MKHCIHKYVGSNRLLVNYVRWSGTLVGQLRLLVKLR
ncbi:hypothetical protein T4D_6514 [Trichinella pseudospiralis]|uniref:Uncharacterized protein n=1 Tax=Trichinella pseudospiralis TaxID=6337 RepID=A0A0V1E9I8_TRIPS|nr:hypothetical protein T4D_6514 [Trichinella pseudospiralis]